MDDSLQFDSRRLAHLFEADDPDAVLWQQEEFEAILLHQLDARLETDIRPADGQTASRAAPLRQTFREVLCKSPTTASVELIKKFSKEQMSTRLGLPYDVAAVLYYASIGAGLVHLNKRISSLDDNSLRTGFDWLLALPWIDDPIRELAQQAVQRLKTA
ncbi:MAG: hypothetical protein AB7U73_25305 [Pirellulales bacterium]